MYIIEDKANRILKYIKCNTLKDAAFRYTTVFIHKLMTISLKLVQTITFVFIISIMLTSCMKQDILSEKEVVDTINRFDRPWETKNMKGVDSVLSPAYIYFTQSGNEFNRDSVVATAGQNNYLLSKMSRNEFHVTITGNTAVVSTRWKGAGSYNGEPFDEDQRCSIVVIKNEGRIAILSEHCTPVRIKRIFH